LLLLLSLAARPAGAQTQSLAVAEGHALAETWCANCHVVGSGSRTGNDAAPSFASIAHRRPDPVAQRARMLAWMSDVDLEEPQLRSLSSLARSVRAAVIADEQAAPDPNVAEALDPVYADIVRAYARGAPSEADLAPLVARLANADRRADARQLRYAHVYRALEQAQAWTDALPRAQAEKLASCRFFIASSLGPLTTPGDYEDWSGVQWRGQDFGAFRTTSAPEARRAVDIGGLWAEDGGTSGPASGRKLGVLVLVAAREAGLIEAIEVRLGLRAPEDYRSAEVGL
jgi:hypothetical protein